MRSPALDRQLITVSLGLVLFGLATLYSAGQTDVPTRAAGVWHRQFVWLAIGIVAAWVVAFVLAFGELGVSVLVAPPGEATVPIRVYTIIANTPASQVAALALLQALVIFVPVAALGAAASLREAQ